MVFIMSAQVGGVLTAPQRRRALVARPHAGVDCGGNRGRFQGAGASAWGLGPERNNARHVTGSQIIEDNTRGLMCVGCRGEDLLVVPTGVLNGHLTQGRTLVPFSAQHERLQLNSSTFEALRGCIKESQR